MRTKIGLTLTVIALLLAGLVTACGGSKTTPTSSPPSPTATAGPTATPTPLPTPSGPQARIQDFINQVDAHALPGGGWERAVVDMTIFMGGQVRAQEASTARVAVEKDLIRVAPNSIFTLGQPDANTMRLDLQQGQVWVNVEGLAPGTTFEVETPAAVASMRGTLFSVRTAYTATIISTRAGTVTVSAAGVTVTVAAGQQTTATPGAAPSQPVPISPEEQIRWGMAAGVGLDVVLPATDLLAGISHVGTTGWPQLSRNCDYLAYSYYDPRDKDNYGTELYDVQAGVLVTGTLPPRADGAAFNNAGDVIAYQVYEDGKSQICTAPLDGSGGSCFGGDGYYGWPFWSPAGDWLLFYASPYGQKGLHLYRARPDGADLQQLTFGDSGYDTGQSWSPDGRQIAYVHSADHEESRALWVMNADGSAAREVLQGVSYEHPAWSPDSDWLVTSGFESSLWLVHPDGTDAHLLPGSEGKDVGQATWSPTPSGWPLFYLQYGEGIWYSYGSDPPGYLGAIGWGPVWSGDYDCAAFGTAVYGSDGKIDRTEVQVFTSEPLFLAP